MEKETVITPSRHWIACAALILLSQIACSSRVPVVLAVPTPSGDHVVVAEIKAVAKGLSKTANSVTKKTVEGASEVFDGAWSVRWCDKTHPELDCGGFDIVLVQEGDRICGDYGGALVNLRQVDEGTIVGRASGNTALLNVESGRSQAIVQVRAELQDDALHWKVIGDVKQGTGDIDVIATDDVLTKNLGKTDGAKPSCDSMLK